MKWDKRVWFPWAGIGLGPAAWGASLQTNYAMVPRFCDGRVGVISMISALLALAAIAGALLSWRAARAPIGSQWTDSSGGLPSQFISWLGVGAGFVFALVILDQFLASLILNGCFR